MTCAMLHLLYICIKLKHCENSLYDTFLKDFTLLFLMVATTVLLAILH